MKLKNLSLLLVFIFLTHLSFAQKLTKDRIEKAIAELKVEARDSIEVLSGKCEIDRERILALIKEKGFDEKYIIGPDRKYLNEGMSGNFAKVPKTMSPIFPNRDKKVALLEKTHVALFHLDLKLNIAKHILAQLDSVKLNEFINDITWVAGDSVSDKMLKKYLAYSIVEKATKNIKFSRIPKSNIDNEIETISLCDTDFEKEYSEKAYIKASFPYDGQYNLHIDDKRIDSDFGFIELGGNLESRLYNSDSTLIAIYTNTEGEYKIVDAKYKSFYRKIIQFGLPHDFLKRGKIFKLQIALRPDLKGEYLDGISIEELAKYNYYNLFKILDYDTNVCDINHISTLFIPIYFRTSIFPGNTEKMEKSKIIVEDDPFVLKIKLKEPFDRFEIQGTKCDNPLIRFSPANLFSYWYDMKKIYSERAAYYLSVPIIQHVNTRRINKKYIALLDNTIESDAIVKANESLAKNYIKDLDEFFDIDFSDYIKTKIKQNVKVRKITKKDFKRGKVKLKRNAVLTVEITSFMKMNNGYPDLVKKMKSRKKKRAKFFYKLHIVDSKRKNIKPVYDLQYYLDREEEIVKSILGSDYENFKPYHLLKSKDKINFRSIIPHTDLNDYNITLPIDYSKFQ